MDPISPFNPAMAALRRQLAENIERLRKAGKLAASGRGQHAEPSTAQAGGLEGVLRRKLSAVDRRSPDGRAQATRIFVEAVLIEEFGEALLSDPGLGQLLLEISASLRQDPELCEQMDALLAEL